MSYEENGVWKNAMVKVNVCTECALKVNYKALKERIEKRKKKKSRTWPALNSQPLSINSCVLYLCPTLDICPGLLLS